MVRSRDAIPVNVLLEAYREGRFPMCHEDGELYWHDPDPRAVFPLDKVCPNARMQRLIRNGQFSTELVRDPATFETVVRACADREETWIDGRLIDSYVLLFEAGSAHAVVVRRQKAMVGGIYGVSIGSAFFGESMFSREANAGKVAFHALVDLLRSGGITLFDTQYINPFTAQLGAVEVPRGTYLVQLAAALARPDRIVSST